MRSDISVHEWFDEQGLRTPAWTFDGEMPGRLIEVTQDQRAEVSYENRVPRHDPMPFEARLDPDPEAPAAGDGPMGHGAWIRPACFPSSCMTICAPRWHGARPRKTERRPACA
jgi:hypothetical protein